MDKLPDRAYRIIQTDHGWQVTVFHENTVDGPVVVYREEALPEWIRKDISLLRLVDQHSQIAGIGHRVGQVYWLLPNPNYHPMNSLQTSGF
jgi:hypothetical protein